MHTEIEMTDATGISPYNPLRMSIAFKQLTDSESFKRWMTDTVFRLSYETRREGAIGV